MRIISGRFKGRQLVAFKAGHIRPTTDRVKETIFNKLMNDIPGAQVLDLFSGTGNLGLEALSRGALHVSFVDSNKKSLRILKQNVDKLGVASEVTILPKDALTFLKQSDSSYDVILIDPPFTKKIADATMMVLSESQAMTANSVIAIESSRHENIQDQYGRVKLLDRKSFGDKSLSIYRVESVE